MRDMSTQQEIILRQPDGVKRWRPPPKLSSSKIRASGARCYPRRV